MEHPSGLRVQYRERKNPPGRKEISMILRLVSSALVMMVMAGPAAAARADSPTETVKNLIATVRSYNGTANGTAATADAAALVEARKKTDDTLAIDALARELLGPHWKTLGPVEQKSFTTLLTRLFHEIAFPKSAEFFGALDVDYRDETVNDAKASVETLVSHPQEGRIAIEYRLERVHDKWLVSDVLLDGVSMVTNVRTQMQQVIAKESYQGLVKRLRTRLAKS
jgi:phospholipid transport system substrate-binding protein